MDLYEKIESIENECFSRPWTYEMIVFEVANPLSVLSMEVVEGKALGFALGHVIAGEGELLRIGTRESCRRQGIADKLLGSLMDKMRACGGEVCFLEVRSKNDAAIGLYQKYGFEQVGIRKRYYGDDDALVMRKVL